jgi:caa(3)-type oxidase subunit IV
MLRLIITFVALVLLSGVQLLLALTHYGGPAPLVGLSMAVLVALGFMQINRGADLNRIFAAAAVFWLAILLGLGSLDPFTRHDVATPVVPSIPDKP